MKKKNNKTLKFLLKKYDSFIKKVISKYLSYKRSPSGDLFNDYYNEVCVALLNYLNGDFSFKILQHIKKDNLVHGDEELIKKVISNALFSLEWGERKINKNEVIDHDLAIRIQDDQFNNHQLNRQNDLDKISNIKDHLTEEEQFFVDFCIEKNLNNRDEITKMWGVNKYQVHKRVRKIKKKLKKLREEK